MMNEKVELKIDFPSKIAAMLLDGSIDVGLVPVAIIPELNKHYIISDYCISCDGEVASVCLFSEVPINGIKKILLDYQSKTSVALLKILIKEYWKIDPVFEETSGNYQSKISGSTAALVIGDRALEQRQISSYVYDLGLAWKKFTGLPFVFAAWISNKKLDEEFVTGFNKANLFGLSNLDVVIEKNPYTIFNLKEYYTHYINYTLDSNKRLALKLFIKKIQRIYTGNKIFF